MGEVVLNKDYQMKNKIIQSLTVMDSVVAWRVQDILQRPQAFDGLRVDPEHVEVAELVVHYELRRRNRHCQRKIEDLKGERVPSTSTI